MGSDGDASTSYSTMVSVGLAFRTQTPVSSPWALSGRLSAFSTVPSVKDMRGPMPQWKAVMSISG